MNTIHKERRRQFECVIADLAKELEAKNKEISKLNGMLINLNCLPVIDNEMINEFMDTCLMTWDGSINRASWSQTAVDFACVLTVKDKG